jgi:azurin
MVVIAGLTLVGAGCSKSEQPTEPVQAPPAAEPAQAPPAAPEAAPGGAAPGAAVNIPPDADQGTVQADGTILLNIESVGDTIAYNKKAFVVPAGKKITLHLKNNATTEAMKHNWILVNRGKVDEVGIAGLQAGEAKQYIPDSPDILQHTELLGPGKETSITFDAPAPGEYEFLCSFPGHYTVMRGVFIVKPS